MSRQASVHQLRLIFAFIFAPILPGLLFALPFLLEGQWSMGLSLLAIGLKITVPPVVLVVLPLYFWLKRSGRLSMIWAVVAGGAGGAAFALMAIARRLWLFSAGKGYSQIWQEIVTREEPHIFIMIGLICGLIGWLLAFGFRLTPRLS